MLNRLKFGHYRYGQPDRSKMYYSRALRALRDYKRYRRKELLIDAANYCVLEFEEPEIANTFYDVVDSQGRNKKI